MSGTCSTCVCRYCGNEWDGGSEYAGACAGEEPENLEAAGGAISNDLETMPGAVIVPSDRCGHTYDDGSRCVRLVGHYGEHYSPAEFGMTEAEASVVWSIPMEPLTYKFRTLVDVPHTHKFEDPPK